jgi:hypothetical protein
MQRIYNTYAMTHIVLKCIHNNNSLVDKDNLLKYLTMVFTALIDLVNNNWKILIDSGGAWFLQ